MKKYLLCTLLVVSLSVIASCSSSATESLLIAKTDGAEITTEETTVASSIEETETTSATNLYEDFLNDECTVIMDFSKELETYMLTSEETFTDSSEYTLSQLTDALLNSEQVYRPDAYLEFCKYAYIDCGMDGNPELAVIISIPDNEEGYNTNQYNFIFKDIDDDIHLCFYTVSWPRRQMEITESGFINIGGSGGAAYQNYEYAFIDAEGNYNFLYRMDTDCDCMNYIGEQYQETIFNNDIFGIEYRFEEDENAESYFTYAKINRTEISYTNGYNNFPFIEDPSLYDADNQFYQLFTNAGLKVYTMDEINTFIQEKEDSAGFSFDNYSAELPVWYER